MLRPILRTLRGAILPAGLLASAHEAADVPMPPSAAPSPLAAIEAIEAADFVERDAPAPSEVDRFGLLAMSLDAAADRGRRDLAAIEAIEAVPRPHGRGHGLEWAFERQFVDAGRLLQAAALLRALAPHEAAVRALLAQNDTTQ